jgi:predicted nucleotidyltransferase
MAYNPDMKRDDAIAKLRQHEAELKALGVQRLYLFGSTARGEARDDSDIDLFFDYRKGELSLFDLMDVKERAVRILGQKADIMTRDSLHRLLRPEIEATALRIF